MGKKYLNVRDHKERTQPHGRKSRGFLEKHKDYVRRAKDYHEKEEKLRKLRTSASLRNTDEFAFKMYSVKTDPDGIHVRKADDPTPGERKASNRANRTYLQMAIAVDTKNAERLAGTLCQLRHAGLHSKHTLFAEDEEEADRLRATALRPLGVPTASEQRHPHLEARLRATTLHREQQLAARQQRAIKLRALMAELDFERKKLLPGKKKVVRTRGGKAVKFAPVRQK